MTKQQHHHRRQRSCLALSLCLLLLWCLLPFAVSAATTTTLQSQSNNNNTTSSNNRDDDGDNHHQHDDSSLTLRIIHITDVYTLENFASLQTLVRETKSRDRHADDDHHSKNGSGNIRTISMLTGDFLMPYLLSTIDGGRGMMAMINALQIDYLTWGNHEKDLPLHHLMEREREYKGTWINSNMPSHPTVSNSTCQKEYEIISLSSSSSGVTEDTNPHHTRRIGMIGILTNAPSLYPPDGKFHGATIQDPYERMHYYDAVLPQQENTDMILPICHFYEAQDERTAREFHSFPLILGGHDHHIVERRLLGHENSTTLLLKPGSDAHFANIVELHWQNSSSPRTPEISYRMVDVRQYEPDPTIQQLEREAYRVLDPLKETQLGVIPAVFHPLSSRGSRSEHSSMASYLGSVLRAATRHILNIPCDAFIVKGGNIRGGKLYPRDQQMTLEVLLSELSDTDMYVVEVPGSILRVGLRETWHQPGTGWFQYDDQVEIDDDGYVVAVDGQPLDVNRTYHIATLLDFFRARDGPTIGNYFKKKHHPDKIPKHGGGYPMHDLLLEHFASNKYHGLIRACDEDHDGHVSEKEFALLDLNGDGHWDKEEVKMALSRHLGLKTHVDEDRFVEYVLQVPSRRRRHMKDNIPNYHHLLLPSSADKIAFSDLLRRDDDHPTVIENEVVVETNMLNEEEAGSEAKGDEAASCAQPIVNAVETHTTDTS